MKPVAPRAVRMAEGGYRAFLFAFPRSFRRRLGDDMAEAFRDGCYAAYARRGLAGLVAHFVRGVAELSHQGLRERAGIPSHRPSRSPRRGTMLDRMIHDLRYSLRALRRAPAFTLVTVLTLALGIGATTAIFSVVEGVLLRPLPYVDPDRLVTLDTEFRGRRGVQLSEPELFDLQSMPQSFVAVGAIGDQVLTLGGVDIPERIRVNQFSAEVLPILGIEPMLGRVFTAADDHPDADRVALLSHGLWRQGFAADEAVLGRTIELEGVEHTVIGVMPEGFAYPELDTRAWIPLRLDRDDPWERNNHYLYGVGRLGEGVSIDDAAVELEVISARLIEQFPEFYEDASFGFGVTGMLESEVGGSRAPLMMLFAAVGFVLLVACTNVANLLLARSESRRREIAVRSALGGGRGAIISQLLAESTWLGILGGGLGLLLAAAGTRLLLSLSPDALPRAENVAVDATVLAFALGVSLLTSLLFGLVPALHAASGHAGSALQEGGRSRAGSVRSSRARAAMVVAEVALATALLVGGSLMMRSFVNLRNVDPGFDHEGVLTVQLALPATEYEEPIDVVRYYDRVIEEVATIPGVDTVGAVARLPLARGANRWSLQIDGQIVEDVADAPVGQIQQATPGYFDAMGIRLVRGRFFDETDVADAPGVALVSETFAREHWGDEDPIGKRVKVFLEDWPWLEVVGVVGDVMQLGLKEAPFPKIYFPHAQAFQTAYVSPQNMHLVVRTAGDPAALVSPVRDHVWAVNDTVPFGLIAPMDEVLGGALVTERFVVSLLSLFAGVAVFLAVVGIAGVIAYSVSERTREIGIRVALGAERADVMRLVVLPALTLTLIGVVAGMLASTLLTGLLEDMLFEVGTVDAATYGMVVVTFLVSALLACYLPARRASRVDPLVSLRAD